MHYLVIFTHPDVFTTYNNSNSIDDDYNNQNVDNDNNDDNNTWKIK